MTKWIAVISTILLIATNVLWAYIGYESLEYSAGMRYFHKETSAKLKRLEQLNDSLLENIEDNQVPVVFNNIKTNYAKYREEYPHFAYKVVSSEYDAETESIKVVVSCE